MSRLKVLAAIEETRLIAILRGDFTGREIPLMDGLLAGGVRVVEVSTVSRDYRSSIQRIAKEFAGQAHIGAGTVLSVRHVQEADDAGATFAVSPNLKSVVVAESRKHDMAWAVAAESELVNSSGGGTKDCEQLRLRAAKFAQAARRPHGD